MIQNRINSFISELRRWSGLDGTQEPLKCALLDTGNESSAVLRHALTSHRTELGLEVLLVAMTSPEDQLQKARIKLVESAGRELGVPALAVEPGTDISTILQLTGADVLVSSENRSALLSELVDEFLVQDSQHGRLKEFDHHTRHARPLLTIPPLQIEDYAIDHRLTFLPDASVPRTAPLEILSNNFSQRLAELLTVEQLQGLRQRAESPARVADYRAQRVSVPGIVFQTNPDGSAVSIETRFIAGQSLSPTHVTLGHLGSPHSIARSYFPATLIKEQPLLVRPLVDDDLLHLDPSLVTASLTAAVGSIPTVSINGKLLWIPGFLHSGPRPSSGEDVLEISYRRREPKLRKQAHTAPQVQVTSPTPRSGFLSRLGLK